MYKYTRIIYVYNVYKISIVRHTGDAETAARVCTPVGHQVSPSLLPAGDRDCSYNKLYYDPAISVPFGQHIVYVLHYYSQTSPRVSGTGAPLEGWQGKRSRALAVFVHNIGLGTSIDRLVLAFRLKYSIFETIWDTFAHMRYEYK